jgi:HK97 family phage major capsid protein
MVDGKPDELFGYSAYKASAVPAWAATGSKKWMVLGDFSRFLIVDQLGMSVEACNQRHLVQQLQDLG